MPGRATPGAYLSLSNRTHCFTARKLGQGPQGFQWPFEFEVSVFPSMGIQSSQLAVSRLQPTLCLPGGFLQPFIAAGFSLLLHLSLTPEFRLNYGAPCCPYRTSPSRHSARLGIKLHQVEKEQISCSLLPLPREHLLPTPARLCKPPTALGSRPISNWSTPHPMKWKEQVKDHCANTNLFESGPNSK
jgi:hypothetical protein